jgi:hypothetical protein
MTYQSFTVSRFIGDDAEHGTTFTVADDDAVNVAHMLAAGFNTMSRNMLGDFVLAVVDKKAGVVYYDGKIAVDEPARSDYAHIAREVLEEAYADHMGIRERMCEAGVETIPVSAGVDELRAQINEHRKRESQNRSARAEMISFVKRAHAKKMRLQTAVPDGDGRPELDDRWRGMLDVLAKFLVVTGEADADEGHAVARKLCGVESDEF